MSVEVTTKIKTQEQARAAMLDTIKNPPSTPIGVVSWLGKNLDVSGALGSTGLGSVIATAFPLVGGALSMLSGVLDMFSTGPSIGQVTLDAIKGISSQIEALGKELTDTIQKVGEAQSLKTTEMVLSGVDDVARQMSATSQIIDMIKSNQIQEFEKLRESTYAEFLASQVEYRTATLANLQAMISDAQAKIENAYAEIIKQLAVFGFDLLPMLYDALKPANEPPTPRAITSPTLPATPAENIASKSDNGLIWLMLAGGVGAFFIISKNKRR